MTDNLYQQQMREVGAQCAAETERAGHAKDSDCAVGVDGLCAGCGVHHGPPCAVCGASAFHRPGCARSDDAVPPPQTAAVDLALASMERYFAGGASMGQPVTRAQLSVINAQIAAAPVSLAAWAGNGRSADDANPPRFSEALQ